MLVNLIIDPLCKISNWARVYAICFSQVKPRQALLMLSAPNAVLRHCFPSKEERFWTSL